MLKRFLASAATTVVLAASMIVPQALATHSWGGYHWARTTPTFTVKLGDNVSAAWDAYLVTASADWSASSALDTVIVPGLAGRNCRATPGRAEVCNGKYGKNGWLGIASVWASGQHITQATVKLNDTYFSTAAYNTPAWKNLVMCQEVGHVFGLAHQDENFANAPLGTCMDYSNDPNPNQHPNLHDYAMLEEIYAHLDATSTVDSSAVASSPAKGNVDHDDPSSWGRMLRMAEDGRSSLHVKDLGNGDQVFTFVIWVDGRDHDHE
jgi:hypothetical protein